MKMDIVLSNTTDNAMQIALLSLLEKAQKDKFGSYIVVAPETKTLQVERFLLDNSKNKAFSNIYIYSFNRLLKRVQTTPIYPLSKEAGVMIVRNLIMSIADNLLCYKKTAGTVGFAENIYETLQQLKSSNISPIELTEVAKKCNTALRIKLEDIALIYDAYENYLGEELIDPSDKLAMLEKYVDVSDRIKNSHMFVVGFDSLTANASSVIKGFIKNALSVTASASFIHKDKKNSHIADNEVFEHLKKIATSLKIAYNPYFEEKKLSGDFEHICNNLYAYPSQKKNTNNNNICLLEFVNIEMESKKTASLIKQDILSDKCRYKDNVIYLADETLIDTVKSAFEEFEIPYFVASPYQFESHQLFVFIKLLFMLIKKNMEAEDVLKFARLALMGLDYDKVDVFENYVLKYGINHSKFLKPFIYKGRDGDLEASEFVRTQIQEVVCKFSDIYNENMTIKEIVLSLNQFLDDFKIEDKLTELMNKQMALAQERDALATKQAYTKAKEVLGMLSQFLGERKCKLDEFYTLLISGLEAADISLLPLSLDSVQIVTTADGLYKVKNLYVLGAKDGNFPRREQDLGLIQDAEISSLEGLSEKKIEPTIKTINRRERYKIFELLLLPENKLTISFSSRTKSGEEVKGSSLLQSLSSLFLDEENNELMVNKIYSVFDNYKFEIGEQELFAKQFGSKTVAISYLAEVLAKYKRGEDLAQGTYNIHTLYKALEPVFSDEERLSFENINKTKTIPSIKNAKELYFPKGTTSISQLEKYFACPFEHFANYGLKLRDRELSNMRALDVGDILHEVAERFVKFYQKRRDINVEKFAINALNQALSDEKYSEDDNRVLINILKGEAVRLCNQLHKELKNSSFSPVETEKWFGGNGEYKGVLLNKENEIELVGKIDRVDETKDHYRIIDYKTGKIDSSAEDIYYGKKLQLALYLSAIKNKSKDPAGVLYFPIHNEFASGKEKADDSYKMKGFILNNPEVIKEMDNGYSYENPKSNFVFPELKAGKEAVKNNLIEFKSSNGLMTKSQLDSMASYAKAIASKAVDEILAGYCAPSPYKHSGSLTCEYCEFKNICGIASLNYSTVREPLLSNAKDFYLGGKIWQKD